MTVDKSIEELKAIANKIRIDIVKMIHSAGSGHPGGSLSSADFATALYFKVINHNPKNPEWDERDFVIFSKGHAAPLLYSCLAESGYFPVKELMTLRKLGSRLQGHPSKADLPGVEVSTGSLGQGLSVACGCAKGLKLSKKDNRVYCIIGDGESQEGSIWEAAMFAAHYKLDNLCAVLDYNHLQIDGRVKDVMDICSAEEKWKSFGWNVIKINGHDIKQCVDAFEKEKQVKGKPTMIIAETVKGKGVSFMENQAGWHGKAPDDEQLKIALKDLGEQ